MSLSSKLDALSLGARTGVVAGSLLLGFGLVVSGVAFAAVKTTQAVFPQDATPASSAEEEVGVATPSPSPVAARSATKATAQKSKRDASPQRGTLSAPGKPSKDNGETLE